MEKNYLVVDIGTGNSRVVLVKSDGKIIDISSFENNYYKDDLYEDAQYFLPNEWKEKIFFGIKEIIDRNKNIKIDAISASGARQSIVCYDESQDAFIGLPNIDNRGTKWMDEIEEKEYIYEKSGRWVTNDFPAAKLMGYRKMHEKEYAKIKKITSLSEWIGEIFTKKICCEPSQACEIQLYDEDEKCWSKKICELYKIDFNILPEIKKAGESLGKIDKNIAKNLNISEDAEFIVGGADTQLAVKAVNTKVGDICIVSGTTSPVVSIVDKKFYDKKERCWTDLNLGGDTFQIETNPGVTGNNFQRFKKVFFPNKTYKEIDDEMSKMTSFHFTASFSSLYFSQKKSLKKGGFISTAPFNANITLIDFAYAIVADIACAIYTQYKSMIELIPNEKDYILGCGGGFMSKMLCQMVANLTEKKLVLVEGFDQASVAGCTWICNEYFGISNKEYYDKQIVYNPKENEKTMIEDYYPLWHANYRMLNPLV